MKSSRGTRPFYCTFFFNLIKFDIFLAIIEQNTSEAISSIMAKLEMAKNI